MSHNRYPGPKAFTDTEQRTFFGRREDIDNLFRMTSLKKVTVLLGKSGTGKSSLLNAGIMPKFKTRGSYDIRSIRFMLYSKELATNLNGELYLHKNIKDYFPLPPHETTFIDKISGSTNSLLLHFKKLQILHENKMNYILILDQFEEIGSYPFDEVKAFLFELNELLNFQIPPDFERALNAALNLDETLLSDEEISLLYEPLKIKIIFTIKSEKIGILHSIKNYISDILQNCYELQPLNRYQAKEAITEPAAIDDEYYYKVPHFSYDEKAVEAILTYLEKSGGDNNFYDNRGIETPMLQLICMHIEQEFANKDINKDKILSLEEMGRPEDLTKDYYEKQVSKLADENKLDERTKKKIYEFVEERLIQVQGELKYREQVFLENLPQRFKIIRDKGLADKLVELGFLRKEVRADERVFYELSHEKLIEPVLAASGQRKNNVIRNKNISAAGTSANTATINNNGELTGINAQLPGSYEAVEKNDGVLTDPYACIRKGDELVSNQDYKKAVDRYTQAINLESGYYYSFYQRGTAYFLSGEVDHAIRDFNKVLELKPDYYVTYNELGRCYLKIADKEKSEKKEDKADENYYKAMDCFKRVIHEDDKAYYAYHNAGLIYLRLLKFEESLPYFDSALKVNPNYSSSYLNRGTAYAILKKYDLAIHDFDTAIEFDPDEWGAFLLKGLSCYQHALTLNFIEEGEIARLYNEAINSLSEVLRLNNSNESALTTRALVYEQIKNYQQAAIDYSTLISLKPDNEYGWFRRGICKAKLENNEDAIADYTFAIELKNDYTDALFERALTYIILQKYDESEKDYDRLIKLQPDECHRAWFGSGFCKYYRLEYSRAMADFTEAVAIFPDYSQAWNYKGLCNFGLSNYQQAIEDYNEAIRSKADYFEAWYNKGLSKYHLEQYQDAIESYSEVLKLSPDHIDAFFERASTLYKIEKYAEAAKDFAAVVERRSDYHQAWYNKGLCNTALKNSDAALSDFSEAIRLKPNYANALFERGLNYFNNSKFRDSLKDFEEITRQSPENNKAWYNTGLCYYELKDIGTAIIAFKKVLSINREDIDALYHLGLCYYEQKKYAAALECFLEVASEKPDFPDINTTVGAAYYYTGDYKKAIEIFTQQINLHQNVSTAYGNRSDAYRRLGDFDKSYADLNKAFELNKEEPYFFATKALLSIQSQKDENAFFSNLETAVEKKFPLYKHCEDEEAFLFYKNDARFKRLVEHSQRMAQQP